jgi:leucyl aminopeptidase (aminopeptidase T)
LPAQAVLVTGALPSSARALPCAGAPVEFERVLRESQIILAPTEYSTTAPLKVAAQRHGFRAATMPGFCASMIPALRLDYGEVARRVGLIKTRLDLAEAADVRFATDEHRALVMHFDLRYRSAHASSGRFPERGTAGNLPSGEAYIVPYEGERGTPSASQGQLPVQIGDEIVVFTVRENRAVEVEGAGPAAVAERDHLCREPAYGNMAELGFGVLAELGVTPVGEILLDEKLGLHVAFGRSEHFGGVVGPRDFSSPAEVIHLDRIYIPAAQPRVAVPSLTLRYPDGAQEEVLSGGVYHIF